eukprot:Awhi_evm1s8574
MENEIPRTTLIEFIPSGHGDQRRRERNITVRELQAAVKNGKCQKILQRDKKTGELRIRCKYTFAGCTYITNETGDQEITCWATQRPLYRKPISQNEQQQIDEMKKRLKTTDIASHTVIIMDQSGSMRESDIPGHYTRSRAAFYHIATDIIAPRLEKNSGSYNDIVTLIEMHTSSSIHPKIYKEPLTWELYNKFVGLAEAAWMRTRDHGNYIPAMDLAIQTLQDSPSNCALLLLFLSDGQPSDWSGGNRWDAPLCKSDVESKLFKDVELLCDNLGDRLVFGTFGFAARNSLKFNFHILKSMSEKATSRGAAHAFFETGLDSASLRTALETSITSLTATRMKLSSLCPNRNLVVKGKMRSFVEETESEIAKAEIDSIVNEDHWRIYTKSIDGLRRMDAIIKKGTHVHFKEKDMISPNSIGIAIKKTVFGIGAERIVYDLMEIDKKFCQVGILLCGKESLYHLHNPGSQYEFHLDFSRTQKKAQHLAQKFNEKLDFLDICSSIPRIEFLSPFFYDWFEKHDSINAILVEEKFDFKTFTFTKWNDNKGGILHVPLSEKCKLEEEKFQLVKEKKRTQHVSNYEYHQEQEKEDVTFSEQETFEKHSEKEYDTSFDEKHLGQCTSLMKKITDKNIVQKVLNDDVPQAFTHWSYVYTQRELLICDLQGIFEAESVPPLFRMTDPVIHTGDKNRNDRPFGATDRQGKGISDFFRTHICNPLCDLLQLAKY